MAKATVMAVVNQKGGTGKTTTCENLGVGLAMEGKKVLLVDTDPQASLTICLGHPVPDQLSPTLSDMMGKILSEQPIAPGEGILHHPEGVDLIPANIELSGLEVSLVNAMSRETILKQYLDTVKQNYDFILLDCIQEVRDVTAYDELQLDTLGDKKTALFLIMSDTDSTFNFLISMIYTQLFNLLCEKADDVYGGRLPVHVRCLIDEAANIGQIPNLEKLVATIRSREISACLVLQAQSQLKAIYKDNADTIIGNMDSRIFLGGSEPTTLKELNQALGKETIDTFNTSNTRGNSPSYGMNYQKLGKDLASVDELAVLDGSKCILQLRGVRPFLSDKYDLTQHPNFKLTADYDKRNEFKIEEFLSHRLRLKADDEFVVVDAD